MAEGSVSVLAPRQRRGSETLVIASGELEARPAVAGRTGHMKKGLFTAVAADWEAEGELRVIWKQPWKQVRGRQRASGEMLLKSRVL